MFSLVTPPVSEPISLQELKEVLRIDHDQDDQLLANIVLTARTFIERRLDLAILPQTWEYRALSYDGGLVQLRPRRLLEVESVTVAYGESSEQAIDPGQYCLISNDPAKLKLSVSMSSGGEPLRQLTVRFMSGFASVEEVPNDLLRAIYLLTAHYYEQRDAFRQQRYVELPYGVEAILETYREMTL